MSNATPGPWRICIGGIKASAASPYISPYSTTEYEDSDCKIIDGPDRYDVAWIPATPNQAANTLLIRAAPEMYECLTELAEIVSSIEAKLDNAGLDISELVELRDWWREADRVIAKAKGE